MHGRSREPSQGPWDVTSLLLRYCPWSVPKRPLSHPLREPTLSGWISPRIKTRMVKGSGAIAFALLTLNLAGCGQRIPLRLRHGQPSSYQVEPKSICCPFAGAHSSRSMWLSERSPVCNWPMFQDTRVARGRVCCHPVGGNARARTMRTMRTYPETEYRASNIMNREIRLNQRSSTS